MILINTILPTTFEQARGKAFFESCRNFFIHQPNELLPFEAVKKMVDLKGWIDRGVQVITLDQIVGSLGRDGEFTRTFWPKRNFTRERWERVAQLYQQRDFAPIEVYQISNVYFVADGHHRISVSRAYGLKTIRAHVIEYRTSTAIDQDDDLNSIRLKQPLI